MFIVVVIVFFKSLAAIFQVSPSHPSATGGDGWDRDAPADGQAGGVRQVMRTWDFMGFILELGDLYWIFY